MARWGVEINCKLIDPPLFFKCGISLGITQKNEKLMGVVRVENCESKKTEL